MRSFHTHRFFEDLSRLLDRLSTSFSPTEEDPEKERLVFLDFSPRLVSLEIVGDRDRSLLGRGLRLRVLSREKLAIGTGLADLALEAGTGLADLTLEALGLLPPSSATSKAVMVGDVSESLSSSEEYSFIGGRDSVNGRYSVMCWRNIKKSGATLK